MLGKKILMLIGEFIEEYEIYVFQQVMEVVGYIVYVVCFDKKVGELIKILLYDFEGDQIYMEKMGYYVIINKIFLEVEIQFDQYYVVYVVGGCGLEYICIDKCVQVMVCYFYEKKKFIFMICYGVQILIVVDGVVCGKKVVVLGVCEFEVMLVGGIYIDFFLIEVYVDGMMVLVKGWIVLVVFMCECLRVFGIEIYYG